VHWLNTERTCRSIDDLTPAELEHLNYALAEPLEPRGAAWGARDASQVPTNAATMF
jgi:hypothetical protein